VCSSDLDSQINVYCGNCSTGFFCLAGNNDSACCAPDASLSFCTEAGHDYYFFIHGFFDVGSFGFGITTNSDFNFGCTNNPTHEGVCQIDAMCVSEATIIEETDPAALMEMCGDDINNGCLTDADSGTAFINASLPIIACGQIDAMHSLRDIDAYRFTVSQPSIITIDLISEFPPEFILFDSDDCSTNVAILNEAEITVTSLTASIMLEPETYVLSVTTSDFSGTPCGGNTDYILRVSGQPIEPCLGDCDASGTVDFNDLVSMLFFFGQNTGDTCDTDENGTVDFNDLVAALFLFGPCP